MKGLKSTGSGMPGHRSSLEAADYERLPVITVMIAKREKQKYLPKELVNNGIHIFSAFL